MAKNTNIPATNIAAVNKLNKKSNDITNVITNPIRAANIFGALSILISEKLKVFNINLLIKHSGLYFPCVKARIKKSITKKSKNTGVFNINDNDAKTTVKKALSLVSLSSVFSFETGQIKSIICKLFSDYIINTRMLFIQIKLNLAKQLTDKQVQGLLLKKLFGTILV